MVDWITLAVPFAYLSVLIGSLATFSSLYRKRKAQKATSLEPWFPPHIQRDIYFSLLHLDDPATNEKDSKKSPAIPESVFKAALLRRATEDIRRVMTLRSQKQALSMLLQRGSVGDDLWQRFLRAEKEMEDEVRDVVAEANAYAPNWGQTIFQSANEMVNNEIVRQRLEAHQAKLAGEKAWWDKRKESIQAGFMKELDAEEKEQGKKESGSSTAAKDTSQTTTTKSAPPAPSVAESDEDAVLVEAADEQVEKETPARGSGGSGGGGGGGGKKKKKGKK